MIAWAASSKNVPRSHDVDEVFGKHNAAGRGCRSGAYEMPRLTCMNLQVSARTQYSSGTGSRHAGSRHRRGPSDRSRPPPCTPYQPVEGPTTSGNFRLSSACSEWVATISSRLMAGADRTWPRGRWWYADRVPMKCPGSQFEEALSVPIEYLALPVQRQRACDG